MGIRNGEGVEVVPNLPLALIGRVVAVSITDPETGEVLAEEGTAIDHEIAANLAALPPCGIGVTRETENKNGKGTRAQSGANRYGLFPAPGGNL